MQEKGRALLRDPSDSICNDYPDDVFRKFEMTGLIVSHGASNYVYYNIYFYFFTSISLFIT